jgi:hypothetical protein
MNEIIWLTIGKSETDVQLHVNVDVLDDGPHCMFHDSFEITAIDVLAYGGHQNNDGSLNDFGSGLLDLVDRDSDLWYTIVEQVHDKHYQY